MENSVPKRLVAVAAVVTLAAACEQTSPVSPTLDAPTLAAAVTIPTSGLNEAVWVCKDAPSGTFDFTVAATITVTGTTVNVIDAAPTIPAGQCVKVADAGNGNDITVTELPATGYTFDHIEAYYVEQGTNTLTADAANPITSPTITRNFGDLGRVFVFFNTENPPPPPPPSLPGRMTGGGSVFMGDVRFTHGFELHCDPNQLPNTLEVNWPDNRFHLTSLTSVVCTDDPALNPLPRKAGFDTYTATGVGLWNGQPGATIEFVFTDDGEPGTKDHAMMAITPPGGGTPVVVDGYLVKGNHQAHWVN